MYDLAVEDEKKQTRFEFGGHGSRCTNGGGLGRSSTMRQEQKRKKKKKKRPCTCPAASLQSIMATHQPRRDKKQV